jgi:hypothetical protein
MRLTAGCAAAVAGHRLRAPQQPHSGLLACSGNRLVLDGRNKGERSATFDKLVSRAERQNLMQASFIAVR